MSTHNQNLREALQQAIHESQNDTELANFVVNSDLLGQIISLATCTESEVREQLNYATPDAVRAALSKARAGKAAFPLPVLEGRRWSKTSVDHYRESSQRNKKQR